LHKGLDKQGVLLYIHRVSKGDTMNNETQKMMDEMVEFAREGNEIIPMFWQPRLGTNATVGAAIRAAKARGLLVQTGLDGVGKPVYGVPAPQLPTPTHFSTAVMQ